MPGWAKKTLVMLAIFFVVCFVVWRPEDAAGIVHSIAGAGQALFTFVKSLATS
jgi:hypothetical protein